MKNDNDHTVTLTQALQDIKKEQGKGFNLEYVNLAELSFLFGYGKKCKTQILFFYKTTSPVGCEHNNCLNGGSA